MKKIIFVGVIFFSVVLQSCNLATKNEVSNGNLVVVYAVRDLPPGTVISQWDIAERKAVSRPANACQSSASVVGHQATFGLKQGKNIFLYDLDGGHPQPVLLAPLPKETPSNQVQEESNGLFVVATTNIAQGYDVKASDVELRDLPAFIIPEDASKSVDAVVGKKATHDIASGDVLCAHDLYP